MNLRGRPQHDGPLHFLIADPMSLVRSGLIHVLGAELPRSRFSEVAEHADLVAALTAEAPDLLLIDPDLPGSTGAASLMALRARFGMLPIMVMSTSNDRSVILSYIAIGMNGCLLKSMSNDQTLNAVRTVLAGGVYAPFLLTPPAPAAELEPPLATHPSAPHFTPRQTDVMLLLAKGLSTKEIALGLNLGVGTVKVHLAAVYRVLGARSRMEAVVRAGALRN